MTARTLILETAAALSAAGVPDAAFDAAELLASVMKVSRMTLRADGGMTVGEKELEAFKRLARRRASGEPLQYILGEAPFYGYMFKTAPGVLIPRFDTEAVCETALKLVKSDTADALDLCAGSGILGIVLALKAPRLNVTLADISPEAAALAEENAARLEARVRVRRGDLYGAVEGEEFDLIVSNPPYIPSGALESLPREVRREPAAALDGGADGLDFYRRILDGMPLFLRKGGGLCLECAEDQAEILLEKVMPLFENAGRITDLSGHPRGVFGRNYR